MYTIFWFFGSLLYFQCGDDIIVEKTCLISVSI
jgi:hypothetical protein